MRAVGLVCVGAFVAVVTGCTAAGPGGVPTASGIPGGNVDPGAIHGVSQTPIYAPASLEVHCGADFTVTVSSDTVAATSAGVPLMVSSDAPAGAYLRYPSGGDALPAEPALWVLGEAPGEMTLSCAGGDVEGPEVTVAVADPNGYWSDATVADYGCTPGAMPSWVIGGQSGDTAQEAVDQLMEVFSETGERPYDFSVRASVGYPEAATQTWLIGADGVPAVIVHVNRVGPGFVAGPDQFCAGALG